MSRSRHIPVESAPGLVIRSASDLPSLAFSEAIFATINTTSRLERRGREGAVWRGWKARKVKSSKGEGLKLFIGDL